MTVVLLEIPVLLADRVPAAGVPLGGGGGGGGAHPTLLHLPLLGALQVLQAPDPRLPAVAVETEAQEALAPLVTTALTGAACRKYQTLKRRILKGFGKFNLFFFESLLIKVEILS